MVKKNPAVLFDILPFAAKIALRIGNRADLTMGMWCRLAKRFPDLAEELNWFLEELGNCLTAVRSERLAMVENPMYVGGGMG